MKQFISISLLIYYIFGALCLPQGDFSAIVDLPEMYHHCKSTEDKDMTPLDFISDHLINVDGLFDKHQNGDEQKPHSPIQFHHNLTQTVVIGQALKITFKETVVYKKQIPFYTDRIYLSNYTASLFRPPIV